LYTGVTDHVFGRAGTHRAKTEERFTKKYNVTRLVYYEAFRDVYAAIRREKQIKRFRREKKVALIESSNPGWADLLEEYPARVERHAKIGNA
jgi:putative endonuclease